MVEEITEAEYRAGVTNSIATKYPDARTASKAPTFSCTYSGTYRTLMANCGYSEDKAKRIEQSYKTLYQVSIDWVSNKIVEASHTGYVTGAFGLRLRTPLIKQSVVEDGRHLLSQTAAEIRSAGNALGQSWCLLTNRATTQVMRQIREHPEYRLKIRPCLTVHDAVYFLIRNEPDVVLWLNEKMVEAVNWNDHPDIYHPTINLGGKLGIFVPNWSKELTLPNTLTLEALSTLASQHFQGNSHD
jgi:DNA polymerase-1